MTCRNPRLWLISALIVAVVGWAVPAGAALLLALHGKAVTGHGAVLLLLWVLAVPMPVTARVIAWHRQSIALHRAYAMGQRHARHLHNLRKKMTHATAMLS